MSAREDPWVALKPPLTDNITYLTFIETNLTQETLPRLHEVLQDRELNQGIGWDLVHLLLPMLPAAEACLLSIAKLGNPREVVLKVSECLRILELDGMEENSEDGTFVHILDKADISDDAKGSEHPVSIESAPAVQPHADARPESELPPPVLQFRVLLAMLSILHPRIKTKHPSRFLSSTLQAVLSTYAEASTCHEEMIEDVIKFIKAVTGTKRPNLPPRRSSSKFLLQHLANVAPDPEATTAEVSSEEVAMQTKLLQSFLTHVLEYYMLSIHSEDDIPGMAWSARLQERADPGHVVPRKQTFAERVANSEPFQSHLATIGSIVALARDVGLESHDLLEVVMDMAPELKGNERTEDDPPSSPEEIPLSKTGSLFLLGARKAAETFYNQSINTPPISIFPQHATLAKNFLGANTKANVGLEPDVLVDTLLFLGLQAIGANAVGEPESDEDFNEYLQSISLLSSNSSSPALRYQAHFLCTTVLRSHPHDLVRLSFIRDTLEHCPYENLKTSAVSWIKGETIEANPPGALPISESGELPSIFATPVALSTISPFLFPDLTERLTAPNIRDSYMQFLADLSFYLAALNFYYLLLKAKHLHDPLDIRGLSQQSDIGGSYLEPLKEVVTRYKEGLKEGGELFESEADTGALMDLGILEDAITRVEEGIVKLNKE
jgi:hypothetical protein